MLSVIVPTLDAEAHLGRALAALVPAAVDGFVREVIVADGGSRDATLMIAEEMGADIVSAPRGRGAQLAAGAAAARGDWLLFLHADTELAETWSREAVRFIAAHDPARPRAAAFRLRLDDPGGAARRIEVLAHLRCRLLRLPYGDQGLLISRAHYEAIGGFRPLPLMEDVDLVRRLGWSGLTLLSSEAVTSAERYRRDGWWARPLRNLGLLGLYYAGVPPERLNRLYG